MSATFKGHKTGFNRTGSNTCAPNEFGPPTTKFNGRPAVPAGPLQRYPGSAADTSGSNRRMAKSEVGAGDGSGVVYRGHPTGFRMAGGSSGKPARTYNTKGGKGSGINRK